MKVVSQDGAIATLIFIPDEAKPLKGVHLPALLDAVGKRYLALKVPTLDEVRTTGAKFQNGLFVRGERGVPLPTLSLHSDGISVTTTDTDDSSAAVDDMFAWLKQEFGFREPSTPTVRLYQSDLVVRFDNDPEGAFEGISSFISFIQQAMTPANAPSKKEVQFSRIAFGADPIGIGATPEFIIERRAEIPWRIGLYFSKAHMETQAHIRALEMLDTLLGGAKG